MAIAGRGGSVREAEGKGVAAPGTSSEGTWSAATKNRNCNIFFTTEEVAQQLRVPESRIRRLCREGELPALKVGKSWRVRADFADALLVIADPGV